MKPEIRHLVPKCGLLLVDGEHAAYRSYYVFPNMSYNGKPTGLIFGFLNLFRTALRRYNPFITVICWGGKRKDLFRRELSPAYKASRDSEEPPVGLYEQIDGLKEIIKHLGFLQIRGERLEADDVIAILSMQASFKGSASNPWEVYILSGDKDLLQLVSSNVKVIAPTGKEEDEIYTIKRIKEEYGLSDPTLLADVAALAGDRGDGVEGIRGIGGKTALKLIQDYGSIFKWVGEHELSIYHPDCLSPRVAKLSGEICDKVFPSWDLVKLPPPWLKEKMWHEERSILDQFKFATSRERSSVDLEAAIRMFSDWGFNKIKATDFG